MKMKYNFPNHLPCPGYWNWFAEGTTKQKTQNYKIIWSTTVYGGTLVVSPLKKYACVLQIPSCELYSPVCYKNIHTSLFGLAVGWIFKRLYNFFCTVVHLNPSPPHGYEAIYSLIVASNRIFFTPSLPICGFK